MENLICDSAPTPPNTNTNARTDNKLRCKEIDLKMKAERFAPLQSSHHIIKRKKNPKITDSLAVLCQRNTK